MDAPFYPHSPIYSVKALARALGEPAERLLTLAQRSSRLYRYVPQTKKDGVTPRHTYDAYEPLKTIQRKIVDRVLRKVIYPAYLHGGIKDAKLPRSIYSNARVHTGAKTVVLQDIADFFPSITTEHIYRVFVGLLQFSPDVATLLASLVTREGQVPQGASTSSYLANLVFWDIEPALVKRFKAQGMVYSRFADDITVSSKTHISSTSATQIIASVTWMLGQKGCLQKRSKLHVRKRGQALITGDKADSVTVTGLVVNGPIPALPKKARLAIRAAVKQLEDRFEGNSGQLSAEDEKEVRRVMGRIGRLIACGHPEGQRLKARVRVLLARAPLLDRYVADAKLHIQEGAVDLQDVDGMTARAMPLESHLDLPWNVG
ncbi:Reverse transcriptase RNA-dependent DNA polymerase [Pseudomonas syringae pv. syringae]|uniref:reverse transcriptase family protein n=1 Tax=Pseudomonas syringae TaxID=317 RepID=UPI0006B9D7FF|nr:reverse transcriptase family protein [Pseudomonas syringae]KPB13214.1 Reverse transcriptase RNA-dependent DNA polymerase [Pseudomonas syringae pv. syringae]WHN05055.1 reverse transcriptase family protein [Pseudomonas syringae pv. syringae]